MEIQVKALIYVLNYFVLLNNLKFISQYLLKKDQMPNLTEVNIGYSN